MAPETPQGFVKQTTEKEKKQTVSEDLKDPDVIESIGAVRQAIRELANWQSKSAEASEFREDRETLGSMARERGERVMRSYDEVFGKVGELIHEEDGEKVAAEVAISFIEALRTYIGFTDANDIKEILPLGMASLSSLCTFLEIDKPKALVILEKLQAENNVGGFGIPLLASAAGDLREAIRKAHL